MQKNKILLLVVLTGMVAACSLAFAADKPQPKAGKPVPSPQGIASKAKDPFPEKKELMSLIDEDNAASEISLDAAWGEHQPFDSAMIETLPVFVPKPKESPKRSKPFSLAGILWSGPRPSAIIDNQVVGVTSVISGMTVKEITENAVTLTDGTEILVLTLRK